MRTLSLTTTLLLAASLPAQLNCTVTHVASSCGPQLTVTFRPLGGGNQRLDLTATGLHPNAITILAFGDQQVNVPLGGGCLLLQNVIWNEIHMSDATGSFSWGRSWPQSVPGAYYMQMGSLVVNASNQLELLTTDCKLGACSR